ncbi:UNVERIFIED_CONTAM: hypothetical protein GTU68_005616 [Idotea baltica]|nr:hypothetical protein [Idotea baltica]
MKIKYLIIILIISLININCTFAKPIYVYKTKNGIVKFSSSKPNNTKFQIFSKYTSNSYSFTYGKYNGKKKNNKNFDSIINKAAKHHNISKSLVKAVIHAESNFIKKAKSKKGALGLMQLMPVNLKTYKVKNPYDPEENIFAGTAYLSKLYKVFSGDLELTLAAYNAGIGNVRKYKGLPPFKETQRYVLKVTKLYRGYLKA